LYWPASLLLTLLVAVNPVGATLLIAELRLALDLPMGIRRGQGLLSVLTQVSIQTPQVQQPA
jgi:hypothetical protein